MRKWNFVEFAAIAVVALAGFRAQAQEPDASILPEVETLAGELGDARAQLDAIQLDDAFKAPIRESLAQVESKLLAAKEDQNMAGELVQQAAAAPQRIESLKKEISGLGKPSEVQVSPPPGIDDLRGEIELTRAALAKLEGDQKARLTELNKLKTRPVEIADRLPVANVELSQAEAKIASLVPDENPSITEVADRLLLEASVVHLRAEIRRLEAERASLSLREQQTGLEQELALIQIETEKERNRQLEAVLKRRLSNEADSLRLGVSKLRKQIPKSRPELRALLDEVIHLVEQFEDKAERTAELSQRLETMRDRLERLQLENEKIRRQIDLGGLEGAYAQVLLERLQSLPDKRGLEYDIDQLNQVLSNAQVEALKLEELSDEQRPLEEELAGDTLAAPVLKLRDEVLNRLVSSQRAIIRDLASFRADERAYRDLVVEMGDFLSDQLFWRRSSDPIGPKFVTELPGAVKRILAPDSWQSLGLSLGKMLRRHPAASAMVALVIAALLFMRRRLRRWIVSSGQKTRRISTDRISQTLGALGATLLLALPLPLFLFLISWGLSSEPNVESWVRGVGLWTGWAALTFLWLLLILELVREDGTGQLHFGWKPAASKLVFVSLPKGLMIYLPGMFFAIVALFAGQGRTFDSVGRLGFIVAQAGLIWLALRLCRSKTGILAAMNASKSGETSPKWRMVGLVILAGLPAAFIILSCLGYTLTALILSNQYFALIGWGVAGLVTYCLGLRWFMIRQRRLALAEALEERQARRDAVEKEAQDAEETVAADDDAVELDLEAVAVQTRHLLRSLVGIGVLIGVAYSVMQALPIDQASAELGLAKGFDWLAVMKAALILTVTVTTVRNLPGLLDLFGLRGSGMEPGTRYAVASLCQYLLGAIGIFAVTSTLSVDWASLSWIAAALSVGLGFGLQEIVANFVCGIILLFERPIRVGDVVTVGEVTGTVSRIRMRATTITNWERQEFVVPNKDFITGSLINWTLSSPLNRITIPVGVAYGSDTVKARQILAEIAAAAPAVLEDPAPLITFEAFADSTLNLALRCYLPNMDARLKTVTDIHEEIDRRFKEAGIEIAFPQQDLHVRTVPEDWKTLKPAGNAER